MTSEVKWAYVYGLDGYTAIIPIEDFISNDSILTLKINGKPLTLEQGFPARVFVSHLYRWKSVKWVHKIELIKDYKDGFWEALGYHPRGNARLEERFK